MELKGRFGCLRIQACSSTNGFKAFHHIVCEAFFTFWAETNKSTQKMTTFISFPNLTNYRYWTLVSLPHSSLYTNSPLFSNTVTMWACYYELVVSVYRPFITKVTSLLAAPSMKLCLEAARAYATMIDTHRRTPGSCLLPYTYYPAFSCAMVLVIDLVAQGRFAPPDAQNQGPGVDATCDLYSAEQKEEDLRRCMRVLEWGETRFQIAGRLR